MKCPQVLNSLVLLQFVIVSVANDEEIDRRRTSNVCRQTNECPTNATCEPRSGGWDGQCICRTGYFMKASGKSRACILIADYGELCYLHEQCQFRLGLSSECSHGQCACKDGSHYVVNENACFKTSKIGDYCRTTANCGTTSTCVRGECRCPYGYHPGWDKNSCLRDVELNEECNNHEECIAEGSLCYNTCKCRTSHIISQDGKRCLPYASTLYQMCHEDSQCGQIPNSCCGMNQTCICAPGTHDIHSRCYVSARLNGECEDDNNCVIAHSSCFNKRCQCDDGFAAFRGKFCSNAERVQISFLVVLLLSFVRLL